MISGLSGGIEKQIGDAVVLSPIILKVQVMGGTIGKSYALAKLDEIARKRDWLGRPIYRYAMKYFDEDCRTRRDDLYDVGYAISRKRVGDSGFLCGSP